MSNPIRTHVLVCTGGGCIASGALAVAAGLAFRWLQRRRAAAGATPARGAPGARPGPAEGP